MQNPIIDIELENNIHLYFELYPSKAPNSINGFIEMIQDKAYDGMSVSRIVPNFVWQPWYDERVMDKKYWYVCDAEVTENGFEKGNLPISHYTLCLAGNGQTLTSPGCFFIVCSDYCQQRLQGRFAAIGQMIKGMDSFDLLVNVPLKRIEVNSAGVEVNIPLEKQVIKTIHLDLNGYNPSPCEKYLPNLNDL